jgi:hypothetical protein
MVGRRRGGKVNCNLDRGVALPLIALYIMDGVQKLYVHLVKTIRSLINGTICKARKLRKAVHSSKPASQDRQRHTNSTPRLMI